MFVRTKFYYFFIFLVKKRKKKIAKDDYVIVCGDFGGVWTFEEESNREKETLNWLNNKNFTTLFVDGNHENYTRLYNDYLVEENGIDREVYKSRLYI